MNEDKNKNNQSLEGNSDSNSDIDSDMKDNQLQNDYNSLETKYTEILNEYENLNSKHQLLNETLLKFKNSYEYLENKYNDMKNNLTKHQDEYMDSCKIRVADMLIGFHNTLKIILKNETNVVANLMLGQLENILNDWEIKVIDPQLNEKYDASMHKVVSSIPIKDNDENLKNCISYTISIGYSMKNKIIKSAEVEVFI